MSKQILYIEDNVEVADSFRRMIEMRGHEVTLAHSYSDGLAALASPFALVISDRQLGDGLGDDLLVEAKRLQPTARTVLLSGSFRSQGEADDLADASPAIDRALMKGVGSVEALVAELKALS
jgi:DNA-binding NtrC family response regulator